MRTRPSPCFGTSLSNILGSPAMTARSTSASSAPACARSGRLPAVGLRRRQAEESAPVLRSAGRDRHRARHRPGQDAQQGGMNRPRSARGTRAAPPRWNALTAPERPSPPSIPVQSSPHRITRSATNTRYRLGNSTVSGCHSRARRRARASSDAGRLSSMRAWPLRAISRISACGAARPDNATAYHL